MGQLRLSKWLGSWGRGPSYENLSHASICIKQPLRKDTSWGKKGASRGEVRGGWNLDSVGGETKASHPVDAIFHLRVPFGKAAFFPGHLIHTNEFLVFLGQGFYTEYSAKQTIDVLDRRRKFLDLKITDLKSQISEIQEESKIFSHTLADAAAGMVEIREEYNEEAQSNDASMPFTANPSASIDSQVAEIGSSRSSTGNMRDDEDDENERIFARIKELELAELAAETSTEDGSLTMLSSENFSKLSQPKGQECLSPIKEKNDMDIYNKISMKAFHADKKMEELNVFDREKFGSEPITTADSSPIIRAPGDLLKFEEWKRQNFEKEKDSIIGRLSEKDSSQKSNLQVSELPAKPTHPDPNTTRTFSKANVAFTGTVMERSMPSLPIVDDIQETKQPPNKPVSKFKMRQMKK